MYYKTVTAIGVKTKYCVTNASFPHIKTVPCLFLSIYNVDFLYMVAHIALFGVFGDGALLQLLLKRLKYIKNIHTLQK